MTVMLGLTVSLGLMALLSIRFSLISSMLASALLSIGLTAPIHFLVVYYKYQKRVGKFRGIIATLKHSGFPITMTSLNYNSGIGVIFIFRYRAHRGSGGVSQLLECSSSLCLRSSPCRHFSQNCRLLRARKRVKRPTRHPLFNRILLALGRLGVTRPYLVLILFLAGYHCSGF